MRQKIMIVVLAGIVVSAFRCSDNEPLTNLPGAYRLVSTMADTLQFFAGPFPPGTKVYPIYSVIDSVEWLNEIPAGGPSRTSIVVHAKDSIGPFMYDLAVETYVDSAPASVPLVHDGTGVFRDTVQIVASNQSGVILPPHDSRLFVSYSGQAIDTAIDPFSGDTAFDTVTFLPTPVETLLLVNPW
jgi:hypothetical protein